MPYKGIYQPVMQELKPGYTMAFRDCTQHQRKDRAADCGAGPAAAIAVGEA